jgi:hypothetical protein
LQINTLVLVCKLLGKRILETTHKRL